MKMLNKVNFDLDVDICICMYVYLDILTRYLSFILDCLNMYYCRELQIL